MRRRVTTLSKKFSHAMHPIKKTFDDGFIHYSSQTDSFGNNSESFSRMRLRGLTKKFPISVNNKQIANLANLKCHLILGSKCLSDPCDIAIERVLIA